MRERGCAASEGKEEKEGTEEEANVREQEGTIHSNIILPFSLDCFIYLALVVQLWVGFLF